MAINPNTDFSSGAILTADQQNRFPRGVMARNQSTVTDASIIAEEIQITSSSFTAVANRYYRITYYEPQIALPATSGAFMVGRIRLTNLAGTQYSSSIAQNQAALGTNYTMTTSAVTTFSAGSVVIVASLNMSTGTGSATRSATSPAFLLVEDIGPA
jgi:hypothetical protein